MPPGAQRAQDERAGRVCPPARRRRERVFVGRAAPLSTGAGQGGLRRIRRGDGAQFVRNLLSLLSLFGLLNLFTFVLLSY